VLVSITQHTSVLSSFFFFILFMSRGKAWCFTLNNYTDAEYRRIIEWGAGSQCEYLVVGRERGASGTPHLQGYVVLDVRKRMQQVKEALGNRVHLELARGTAAQNREYCTKENDFSECGTLPVVSQGKRTDLDRFKSWVLDYVADNGRRPSEREIALEHSSLWLRYQPRLMSLLDFLCPPQNLVDGDLRPWQLELFEELKEPCTDDRSIVFYYDIDGGKGKSWFCRYCFSKLERRVQLLSVAKRDDLAHAIDPTCDIFLINVPRLQMEYLRYEILESLKDRTVFSPKYQSGMKILAQTPHVVVFANEAPVESQMTADRYVIRTI